MYGFVSPERTNSSSACGHGDAETRTLYMKKAPIHGANDEEHVMSTPEENPRAGFRLASLRGGPVVPLVGVCVGVVALTAAVTLGGQDSSSTTGDGNAVTALATGDPGALP